MSVPSLIAAVSATNRFTRDCPLASRLSGAVKAAHFLGEIPCQRTTINVAFFFNGVKKTESVLNQWVV